MEKSFIELGKLLLSAKQSAEYSHAKIVGLMQGRDFEGFNKGVSHHLLSGHISNVYSEDQVREMVTALEKIFPDYKGQLIDAMETGFKREKEIPDFVRGPTVEYKRPPRYPNLGRTLRQLCINNRLTQQKLSNILVENGIPFSQDMVSPLELNGNLPEKIDVQNFVEVLSTHFNCEDLKNALARDQQKGSMEL